MIQWRAYLDLLKEDGVDLVECELEAVDEAGERTVSRQLIRWVDGQLLYCPASFGELSEIVPPYRQRQIANRLRLPPEKYIFETW